MSDIGFILEGYHVDSIDFKMNNNIEALEDEIDAAYKLTLNAFVDIEDSNRGKVTIIFETPHNDSQMPFYLCLEMTAVYKSNFEISEDDFVDFLKINGSAHLFPFMRSAVADITRVANVPPLVLPLLNIYELIKQQEIEDDN